MRILLANDDGINSPGLALLARTAARLGEVWVVAPAGQCSAMSQRITVFGSLDLNPVEDFPVAGVHAFSITGSPADCVKVALAQVMPSRPDVVFSGINNGFNVGGDILYSGTIGVAFEALTNGIPAIAFSSGMDDLRSAEANLETAARDLLARPLPPDELWNVNFPACAPDEVRGTLTGRTPARQPYYCPYYTPAPLPGGGARLTLTSRVSTRAEAGSDMDAVLNNFISVGRISNGILKARGK